MSIEVKHLVKTYGEQKAVDSISFKVDRGEIVGFLGPNGAGKSTTMKILSGYLGADAGDAVVCGIPVKAQPLQAKKKIGYLPEANPLYPDMYVREYLDFIADVHHVPRRWPEAASTDRSDISHVRELGYFSSKTNSRNYKNARIEAVIQLVGLAPESRKRLGQLSKGYKQRVGLAAALLHDPEVLILDEPTSGLDPNQIVDIRDVIRQLGKNKTVLFSSHILQEVEALCDRVIIINKGRLVADSTISRLRSEGNGSNTIRVAFREAPEAARLQRLNGVNTLTRLSDNEWELQTDEPDAVKKQLLELALQNNWNIVSLQSENQSLEAIFRSLTKQE